MSTHVRRALLCAAQFVSLTGGLVCTTVRADDVLRVSETSKTQEVCATRVIAISSNASEVVYLEQRGATVNKTRCTVAKEDSGHTQLLVVRSPRVENIELIRHWADSGYSANVVLTDDTAVKVNNLSITYKAPQGYVQVCWPTCPPGATQIQIRKDDRILTLAFKDLATIMPTRHCYEPPPNRYTVCVDAASLTTKTGETVAGQVHGVTPLEIESVRMEIFLHGLRDASSEVPAELDIPWGLVREVVFLPLGKGS